MCTLYERIIDLCHSKGVTGSRMCLDLGLSKSTLSDIKSGRKKGVSTETALKIASYFNVSVGYLLGEEDKKEQRADQDDALSNKTISDDLDLSPEKQLLINEVRRMDREEIIRLLRIIEAMK